MGMHQDTLVAGRVAECRREQCWSGPPGRKRERKKEGDREERKEGCLGGGGHSLDEATNTILGDNASGKK